MNRLGVMGLVEVDHRGKVPFSSCHTKSTYCQRDLPLLVSTWITWPRCVCQASLLWSYSVHYGFPQCPLWREVATHSPCLRSRRYPVFLFTKFGNPNSGPSAQQLHKASGQCNYILEQWFSTGMPQEFLKHAIHNHLVRGTNLFSFTLSNLKTEDSQHNNSCWYECPTSNHKYIGHTSNKVASYWSYCIIRSHLIG